MKRQTTTKAVASAVATIDYFVKRGWDVSYGIGDIRMFNEDAPEYEYPIYILTIYRRNTELYLENYESLEDLLIGASAWLVQFAQSDGRK